MLAEDLKVGDLRDGLIIVRKASTNYGCYRFYEISYVKKDRFEFEVKLQELTCRVRITRTRIENSMNKVKVIKEYTKVTDRWCHHGDNSFLYLFSRLSNLMKIDALLSNFELYDLDKKYEEVSYRYYDSDSDSDSDSDHIPESDIGTYSDYDEDSDLIQSNMEIGSIVVKKPLVDDVEYYFYRIVDIKYDKVELTKSAHNEKKYYPITGSDSIRVEYKLPERLSGEDSTVSRCALVSDYEVYDLKKKYELVIRDVVINSYWVSAFVNRGSNKVKGSVIAKINMEIGEIVVKILPVGENYHSFTFDEGEQYSFYRIVDISPRKVRLTRLRCKKEYHPITGSCKMKMEFKLLNESWKMCRFVSREVLFSDYEAYDLNKKYELVIRDVVIQGKSGIDS